MAAFLFGTRDLASVYVSVNDSKAMMCAEPDRGRARAAREGQGSGRECVPFLPSYKEDSALMSNAHSLQEFGGNAEIKEENTVTKPNLPYTYPWS